MNWGPSTALVLAWAGLMTAACAAEMTFAEATAALASDDFEVREQGDHFLRRMPLAEYAQVEKLLESSDPEVTGRANAALPIIRMDIDRKLPEDLVEKLYNFDRLPKEQRAEAVAALTAQDVPRATTLISLHSYWLEHPEMVRQGENAEFAAIEEAMGKSLAGKDALKSLLILEAGRYQQETLGKILNQIVRQTGDNIHPLLPLYVNWSKAHPDITTQLNADGYRLEIVQQISTAPNEIEALRSILKLGTGLGESRDRMAALRRQLAEYREVALKFPVESLDQNLGSFFFETVGSLNGAALLDAYCDFRRRFPDIHGTALNNQTLEVLRITREEGPSAGMDFALALGRNDGISLLAEWFREHPEAITEPLPLPDIAKGADFSYRPLKFVRIFAPYPTEAELAKHPKIAAAVKILKQDSKWVEAFRQAQPRIVEDLKAAENRQKKDQ